MVWALNNFGILLERESCDSKNNNNNSFIVVDKNTLHYKWYNIPITKDIS